MKMLVNVACVTILAVVSVSSQQEIFSAIRNGDLKAVKEFIEKNPASLEIQDVNRMTPLMYASFHGQREVAAYLIERGANVNYERAGESCLHQAAQMNRRDVVALLLDHGADIESQKPRTPLYYAISAGAREAAELLIERGSAVPVSSYLLHRAVQKGISTAVDRMIADGADLLSQNHSGGTLLHSASEGGMVLLVELMLAKGAGIDARDRYGRTPLHLAAANGHLAVVRQLVRKGAGRDIAVPTGATAYDLARSRGHVETCTWLVAQGAAPRELRFMATPGDSYFGLTAPGDRAEVFAPGIVSSADELEHGVPVWSPDGNEVIWSTLGRTYHVEKIDGRWTLPHESQLHQKYRAMHVAFSPDGQRMYFDSDSTMTGDGRTKDSDIWIVERRGNAWSEPINAGPAVNSTQQERSASIARNGNLYFESNYDIYRSVWRDGRYQPREKLGGRIDTEHLELGCLIAPDESYLIFSSSRPRPGGPESETDTYVSFRTSAGSWSEPRAFGREHGVVEHLLIGFSPDGRYLFFGAGDVQWIDARIVARLRR